MATKTKATRKTPAAREAAAGGARPARRKTLAAAPEALAQAAGKADRRKLIQALIRTAMRKLEKGPEKATITDLIRLLSLEKEIGEEAPSKVVVEWIDPRTGAPWKPTE